MCFLIAYIVELFLCWCDGRSDLRYRNHGVPLCFPISIAVLKLFQKAHAITVIRWANKAWNQSLFDIWSWPDSPAGWHCFECCFPAVLGKWYNGNRQTLKRQSHVEEAPEMQLLEQQELMSSGVCRSLEGLCWGAGTCGRSLHQGLLEKTRKRLNSLKCLCFLKEHSQKTQTGFFMFLRWWSLHGQAGRCHLISLGWVEGQLWRFCGCHCHGSWLLWPVLPPFGSILQKYGYLPLAYCSIWVDSVNPEKEVLFRITVLLYRLRGWKPPLQPEVGKQGYSVLRVEAGDSALQSRLWKIFLCPSLQIWCNEVRDRMISSLSVSLV